jgi:hypothetical protein
MRDPLSVVEQRISYLLPEQFKVLGLSGRESASPVQQRAGDALLTNFTTTSKLKLSQPTAAIPNLK